MDQLDSYIHHNLNNSPTKEAHVFPKTKRFQQANRLYRFLHLEPQKQSTTSPQLPHTDPPPSASAIKFHSKIEKYCPHPDPIASAASLKGRSMAM